MKRMRGFTVKKFRERIGMTQVQFAAAIGVAQSTVANWESGFRPRRVYALMMIALAEAHGITLAVKQIRKGVE